MSATEAIVIFAERELTILKVSYGVSYASPFDFSNEGTKVALVCHFATDYLQTFMAETK